MAAPHLLASSLRAGESMGRLGRLGLMVIVAVATAAPTPQDWKHDACATAGLSRAVRKAAWGASGASPISPLCRLGLRRLSPVSVRLLRRANAPGGTDPSGCGVFCFQSKRGPPCGPGPAGKCPGWYKAASPSHASSRRRTITGRAWPNLLRTASRAAERRRRDTRGETQHCRRAGEAPLGRLPRQGKPSVETSPCRE